MTKWSAVIGQFKSWGGGQNHPPKSVRGFVWADQRRCDWSDKNDVIKSGIYSGVKPFFCRIKDGDGQIHHVD